MKHSTAVTSLTQIPSSSVSQRTGARYLSRLSIVAIAAVLIFSWLAGAIISDRHFAIDAPAILQAMHGHRWIVEKLALVICSSVGILGFSVLSVLLYRRMFFSALFWLCAVGGSALLESFFKKLIRRPRPEFIDLLTHQSSFAFPSGHAMQSAAIVLAAAMLFGSDTKRQRRLYVLGCIFIGLVGFSRLYLGAHYPTDILAGWALSTAWVCALGTVFNLPRAGTSNGLSAF